MASKSTSHTASSPNGRQTVRRSDGDSFRWIAGLLLFFIGLFIASSVFFSFFCWEGDQSLLTKSLEERETLGGEAENLCGLQGAWIGHKLVDRSFGIFGMLIPVMLMLVGLRIIRKRPLLLNHSILSLTLVMILGSLTLGFAFGDRWSLCASTGWGGAYGIAVGQSLHTHLGVFGTIILLLGGWILLGVFINRNFINTVNSAGNVMVGRGERIVEIVRHKVVPHACGEETEAGMRPEKAPAAAHAEHPSAEPSRREHPAETAAAEDAAAPEGRNAALRDDAEPLRSQDAAPQVAVSVSRPAPQRAAQPDEDPFVELTPDGRPVEQPRADDRARKDEDEEFIEFDLSHSNGRLVMGAGGLVELEPAPRRTGEAAVRSDASKPVPEDSAAGPFTEITVGGEPVRTAERTPAREQERDTTHEVFELHDLGATSPAPGADAAGEMPGEFPEGAEAPHAPEAAEGVVVTVEAGQARLVDEKAIPTESYDPLKDLVNYRKPPVTLLEDYISDSEVSDEEIFDNKTRIEETLKYFGIPIQRIKATVGPTVTLYEIVQAQGVKIAKIQGLQNDIAQSLKAESGIRIIAPIPGRGTIGIEVPNRNKQVVSMYSAVRSLRFQESKAMLPVVIGRTIQNENFVFDLAKMPHLLVAGATGMGKSVGLNAIITSLLYRMHPAQLKFVMIDPKMVEFSLYAKIERHFLAKMESEDEAVVTDPKKAVYTLNALCVEMDNRLELCKKAGARNIGEYNEKFTARRLNPLNGHRFMPYIVVVIDEFADLIMTAKEVEMPVTRLAQKARAVGIHLIVATQRPSVDVIPGKIKANFPARIAFRVMQMIDSRTILDRPGADQLIGRGDMLISKDGELTRIQCALVDTPEVERIVDYISKQQGYTSAYALPDYTPDTGDSAGSMGSDESSAPVKYDSLFAEIAREAVSGGNISTSMIQRNYEVGFNRAGRIMMQLERAGIVGRQQGAKPRDILFHDLPSLEARLQELGLF